MCVCVCVCVRAFLTILEAKMTIMSGFLGVSFPIITKTCRKFLSATYSRAHKFDYTAMPYRQITSLDLFLLHFCCPRIDINFMIFVSDVFHSLQISG